MRTHFSTERVIEAPAHIVYHLLADYREHHRHGPEGFLPPAFTKLVVEQGGVGAGTAIRFTMVMAGKARTTSATVSEPEPGRVLVETGPGVTTTFTVEPVGERRARVRFDTVLDTPGLEGLLTRLLGPRMLRPLYADELTRLEQHARAHE